MQPNWEGFLYPEVSASQCVDCGLCEAVCPILRNPVSQEERNEAYVVRTKSSEELSVSTSGGFTSPLARWVFERGGIFWAATYEHDWKVCHKDFTRMDETFCASRGSKYVQSYLGNSFLRIKQQLQEDKLVCFVGTSCQVYGLKSFLKKEYDNLITVDLVCHGTPSPKLWGKYIAYQTQKYGSSPAQINFRNKTYGYHSGTMWIRFENGKEYTGSARVDLMLKSFFSEISSRPSCYECFFKQRHRVSDFTIFDCWHMADLVPGETDDDRGYTNILVQSKKGHEIFKSIWDNYVVYEVDSDKAIALDGVMIETSAKAHPKRDRFYEDLEKHDLLAHVKQFVGLTFLDFILENVKQYAYVLGLMDFLRESKKKLTSKNR